LPELGTQGVEIIGLFQWPIASPRQLVGERVDPLPALQIAFQGRGTFGRQCTGSTMLAAAISQRGPLFLQLPPPTRLVGESGLYRGRTRQGTADRFEYTQAPTHGRLPACPLFRLLDTPRQVLGTGDAVFEVTVVSIQQTGHLGCFPLLYFASRQAPQNREQVIEASAPGLSTLKGLLASGLILQGTLPLGIALGSKRLHAVHLHLPIRQSRASILQAASCGTVLADLAGDGFEGLPGVGQAAGQLVPFPLLTGQSLTRREHQSRPQGQRQVGTPIAHA